MMVKENPFFLSLDNLPYEGGVISDKTRRRLIERLSLVAKGRSYGLVNPIKVLSPFPALKKFIETIHEQRYRSFGLPSGLFKSILATLVAHEENPDLAAKKVYQNNIRFMRDQRWADAVRNYIAKRYQLTYALMRSFIRKIKTDGLAVDVGAGTNAPGAQIAQDNEGWTVIGTDVLDYCETSGIPNLIFRKQDIPEQIPVADSVADLVVLNAVLHHVAAYDFDRVIDEIRRVLKPHGAIIILEDTFSQYLEIDGRWIDQVSTDTFFNLVRRYGPAIVCNYLIFMDWYTNIVVKEIHGMSMPYNFHSIEGWAKILQSRGFEMDHAVQCGLVRDTLHRPCIGVIFLWKKQKLPKEGPLPINPIIDEHSWQALQTSC